MGMGFATLGSVSPDAGFFAFDHSQPLMAAQLAGTVKTVLSDPPLKTRILLLTITLLISFGLLAECPIDGSYHKRRAAVERLAALSDDDVMDLLFAPGFSTASAVTAISGRGVGLDAVRSAIERLGGRVSIHSHAGAGTTLRFVAKRELPGFLLLVRVCTLTS